MEPSRPIERSCPVDRPRLYLGNARLVPVVDDQASALGGTVLEEVHTQALATTNDGTGVDPVGMQETERPVGQLVGQAELAMTRERGYAIDDHEFSDNMRCIAAPIFERDVPVRLGVSISGPDSRFSLDYLESVRPALLESTNRLSEQLGGRAIPVQRLASG